MVNESKRTFLIVPAHQMYPEAINCPDTLFVLFFIFLSLHSFLFTTSFDPQGIQDRRCNNIMVFDVLISDKCAIVISNSQYPR